MDDFAVGCHLSVSKGFLAMGRNALSIGANTFQFFSRNPRGGASKALDEKDVRAYLAFAQEHGFFPMLAHAPYTLNCCAKDENVRDFARRVLKEDLQKLSAFPGTLYNFHPGSHAGQGEEEGIRLIAEALNEALCFAGETTVLLETMAGKGSEVGASFENLAKIMSLLDADKRDCVGVCLDTCHVFDAGYDIANDLDGVLEEFDRVIGLSRLRAVHVNDSKNPRGSRKDRHETLGNGTLGEDAFRRIVCHPALLHVPFYLETPQESLAGYAQEIALLKQFRQQAQI